MLSVTIATGQILTLVCRFFRFGCRIHLWATLWKQEFIYFEDNLHDKQSNATEKMAIKGTLLILLKEVNNFNSDQSKMNFYVHKSNGCLLVTLEKSSPGIWMCRLSAVQGWKTSPAAQTADSASCDYPH